MTPLVQLRSHVREILAAAISAVDPERLVREWLDGSDLARGGERIHLLAVGKAGPRMARGALSVIWSRVESGIVLTTHGTDTAGVESDPRLRLYHGGHPVPDEAGFAAAVEVALLAGGLGPDEHLLSLLSGGGSALLTLPEEGLTLSDVRETTDALLRAGATIRELNTVRKHLERLKGGGLARLAAPARVTGLVLSDVVGDPLDVIASGPLSPDPTTFQEALATLNRCAGSRAENARRRLEEGARGSREETPKAGDPLFRRTAVEVVGRNLDAVQAAAATAEALGYESVVLSTELEGEAREVGRTLATAGVESALHGHPGRPPACLISGGETTVTVRGKGIGGRNQEVALAAGITLDHAERSRKGEGGEGSLPIVVASVGTDGVDGLSAAAGALVDPTTVLIARSIGLDPDGALNENDTDTFFAALDGHQIITGPTGTNVMDVQVVLVARRMPL